MNNTLTAQDPAGVLPRERMGTQDWVRIFDAVHQPITILDPDRRIIAANRATEKWVGRSEKDLIGRKCHEVFHRTASPLPDCPVEKMMRSGRHDSQEGEIEALGGTHLITCTPQTNGSGEIVSIIHVATDITERKRWERQLEESEAKFRELFDNMSSGVVVYEVKDGGRDFVIKAFNRAAERIERIKKEDVLGRAVTEVFPGVEKFGIFDAFRRVWQTGRPEFLPLGFYQDRRVTGWRENYVYKLPSGEIVAVYDDVTERKRTEESLQRSFDQLRRTLMSTINALTAAVEMRDPYTGGHQHRVPNLACAIARQMDLSEDQIAGLRVAGLVHDVGKINVPAEILSKPGKLSPAEYSLAQGHVQLSYEMLRQIEFPWPVAEIVLQHHERLDGSGYPRRLRGEEILPEARILGVADVVEAMSTHRPYRPAQGLDKALAEIKRGRGTLFDPLVVDACLGLFSQDGYRLEDEGAASVDSWSAFDIDKVLPRSSFL